MSSGYNSPQLPQTQNQTASHRLTLSEAQDRAMLLALFDKLDARGQRTTLAMLAVAVKLHPKERA